MVDEMPRTPALQHLLQNATVIADVVKRVSGFGDALRFCSAESQRFRLCMHAEHALSGAEQAPSDGWPVPPARAVPSYGWCCRCRTWAVQWRFTMTHCQPTPAARWPPTEMNSSFKTCLALAASSVLLVACGGGNDDDPPPPATSQACSP